jgi:predicted nucleotidyltransferase
MTSSVAAILTDLKEGLSSLKPLKAAIVLGSVARGEESYVYQSGEKLLASDIEIMAVVEGLWPTKKLSTEILAAVSVVEKRYQPKCASGFHLDTSIVCAWRLPLSDHRFIHFETQKTGQVLLGELDIISRFPDITAKSLNKTELHSVLIHRLFAVLRTLEAMDDGTINRLNAQKVIYRNGLDLLSVLLPHCGQLVAGYRNRFEIAQSLLPQLSLNELGHIPDFLHFLERCLAEKLCETPAQELDEQQHMLLLSDFTGFLAVTRETIVTLEGRPFFRRNPRRLAAAALRLSWHQFFMEWRRGQLENELFTALFAAIQRRRNKLPAAGTERFSKQLAALYPGAY